jgi:hypothetical protein
MGLYVVWPDRWRLRGRRAPVKTPQPAEATA